MIKHVLKYFRSLTQAACAGFVVTGAKARLPKLVDAWLFEDKQTTQTLIAFPRYPSLDVKKTNENVELKRLGESLAGLVQDMDRLRLITLSAQKLAVSATEMPNANASIYTGFALGHSPTKWLSDPVITEELFGHSYCQQELDLDLFDLSDSGDTDQMLTAYQASRSNGLGDADLHYSSRSGG